MIVLCARSVLCVGGREEVGARAILSKVGFATLGILLYTQVCTANRQERVVLLLDRRRGVRVRGRARDGWVGPPDAG